MRLFLGAIALATSDHLTGPVAASTSKAATIPQYAINRGKPVPHVVGDELDLKRFSFFFDETFCNVVVNNLRLESAFAAKSPLPLVIGAGSAFRGTRFIVDALDVEELQHDRFGVPVRISGEISLIEDPLTGGLLSELNRVARERAIARGGRAGFNAEVRR